MSTAVHQYEDKLLEFAYGELPAHEADAVEAHVLGCARCSQLLSELRSVRTTMAVLTPEPAPAAGLESLLAYAEAQAQRNAQGSEKVPFWKKYLTPLMVAMAAVTVGVVTVQANKEIDLSPAAAATDKKLDEYKTRRSAEDARPPSPTQAQPAPMEQGEALAAEPEPTPARDLAAASADKEGAMKSRAKGKANFGETNEWVEEKRAMPSTARREAAPKPASPAPKDEPSKVLKQEAPPPVAVAKEEQAPVYGLGTGSAAPSSAGAGLSSNYSDAVGRGGGSASPPAPSAAPAKKSMKLSPPSYRAEAEAADDEAVARLDAVKADSDSKLVERQRTQSAADVLARARTAASAGDRQTQVTHAVAALEAGASGSTRLEALDLACKGFEALGQPGKADSYCDALLTEFPQSSAAQSLAKRRGYQQKHVAPAAASEAAQ